MVGQYEIDRNETRVFFAHCVKKEPGVETFAETSDALSDLLTLH